VKMKAASDLLLVPKTKHRYSLPEKIAKGIQTRQQILQDLSDGYTPMQVAMRLEVSRTLIQYHMAVLHEITGLVTEAGIVGWAFRKGLLK
jgi:DNA-binding CsgD family transcriptional regulator